MRATLAMQQSKLEPSLALTKEIAAPTSLPLAGTAMAPMSNAEESALKGSANGHAVTIKIDAAKIDAMMNRVGELVVLKSQIMQLPVLRQLASPQLVALLAQLDRNVRDLHDSAIAMRMTSFKQLFLKLKRTTSELASSLGKQIQFTTIGEDTELDRSLLELLADPLIHLCRNAIDHGLELPLQRQSAGKPAQGTLKIYAYRHGGNAIIEVTDDGQGISKSQVLKKAIAANLVSADAESQNLSDGEIFELIFTEGFTTAQAVTSVSGRGVGMAIVKKNIAAIKGHVTISSKEGAGTTVKLIVPLTTAITDSILIKVGSERFIVPIEIVAEFVRLQDTVITSVSNDEKVAKIRDTYMPLIDLKSELLGEQEKTHGLVMVIESTGKKIGVLVDQVLGQSQVVLKTIDSDMRACRHISGAAILGDGEVGLVLDIDGLLATTNLAYADGREVKR